MNSELWFVNNEKLEERILAHLAKYSEGYQINLYAYAIEGYHIQALIECPLENRSDFMWDHNSVVAKLVGGLAEGHLGGKVFDRRYSCEIVPVDKEDIEDKFFYIALQSIQDGLVQKISDYPGYNCFHDAAWQRNKEFKTIDWRAYRKANRRKKKVPIKNFETIHTLKYKRIPGYEHLNQKEYAQHMSKKLEERRSKIVNQRLAEGKGFAGREALKKVCPGSRPHNSTKSERFSHRPRVLSVCPLRRKHWLEFYFDCYYKFKEASIQYRSGVLDTVFPPGMFRPYLRPPPTLATIA